MKRAFAVVVLCLLDVAAARADEAALWLDEARAVELALADAPALEVAEEELAASTQSKRAALLGLVPELQLTGRYTRLSSIDKEDRTLNGFTFPQVLNQAGVRAVVSVALSQAFLNLAANVRALGHVLAARELERNVARAQTAYDVRVAFLRYWRAQLGLATALELTRASQSQLDDQRAREQVGSVSRNDVLSFEVALDAAVLGEQSARKELVSAEAGLRRYLPSAGTRALTVPELDARALAGAAPAPPSADTSPRVRALVEHADAAKETARSASYDRLPRVSLYAAGDYAGPNPRVFVATTMKWLPTWEAGVRVEWALSQALAGGALAERARAFHRQLLARVDDLRRQLAAERASTLGGLEIAHERVARSGERAQRARALAEARRDELEAGTALPLNVIVAETDLARARNEHTDAIVERALAHASLDYLDGRVTPSSSLGSAP